MLLIVIVIDVDVDVGVVVLAIVIGIDIVGACFLVREEKTTKEGTVKNVILYTFCFIAVILSIPNGLLRHSTKHRRKVLRTRKRVLSTGRQCLEQERGF